jgi:hypothetical protein
MHVGAWVFGILEEQAGLAWHVMQVWRVAALRML